MALSADEFRRRYRALASVYDPALWFYRVLGMRIEAYRKTAVQALHLQPGDTVVDLGCGTGLNFGYLQRAVGEAGHIIGVDLTDGMLAKARRRARQQGWRNVELVEADMAVYEVPATANGVLSTLALSTVADYDDVVARAARRLKPGARFSNFELRWPERWPSRLARFAAWLNRPAGVTPDIVHRLPATAIARHFTEVEYHEMYFGAVYLCAGTSIGNGDSTYGT